MSILKVNKLVKKYGSGDALTMALNDVDLSVEEGEFVSIVGTSGSGKSTLLHVIGGLDRPTSGNVEVAGINLLELTNDELTVFRRRNIGFVFQQFNLIPICNVYDNIVLPIILDGENIDKAYVDEIIDLLGLKDKKFSFPNQLSGGQQQRVAIARSLATKPKLILADEPTGNLDSKNSQEVINLLRASSKKYCQTVLMITHNDSLAKLADRIVVIEDGQITSEEVYCDQI